MSESTRTELSIRKAPDGGYIVYDTPFDRGYTSLALFAASSIGEALDYIKSQLGPKKGPRS